MRAKLKYNTTETGKHLTPNSGGAPYEFDVYATCWNPRSIRFARIGALIYVFAGAIYFFQWNEAEEVLTDAVELIEPSLAGSALVLFGLVGFVVALYNIKKLETKAFVECKDLKSKGVRQSRETLGRTRGVDCGFQFRFHPACPGSGCRAWHSLL